MKSAKNVVVGKVNKNYNKTRTEAELTKIAENIKSEISQYSDRESKWSGKIHVDNSLSLDNVVGQKEWTCDIKLIDTVDDGTIWHEMLHSCSVSHYDEQTYILNEAIEEASVEFLKQQICRQKGIMDVQSYPIQVRILQVINERFAYGTDIEFAKRLFNVPLPNRYQWLEDIVDNSLRELDASFSDYNDVIGFLEQLKGAI